SLTDEAVRTVLANTNHGEHYTPVGEVIGEKSIVNAIVGLLATGGSTNHTIHLIAIARAAGVIIDWDDFAELSHAVPLLARVYPNGMADVNHFHAAGGLGFVMRELLDAGLLHDDVKTLFGDGLHKLCVEPFIHDNKLEWRGAPTTSLDEDIVRPVARSFDEEGGLRLVKGEIGRAIVKVSAVEKKHYSIKAPAKIFSSQEAFKQAFNDGELESDFVAVLPGQGPSANGMPELHKLTPYLGLLQNRGFKVALLTDGRMSGASGKVLAAIQVTPEANRGGAIGKLRDGDVITIDSDSGILSVNADLSGREPLRLDLDSAHVGMGRELFGVFRDNAGGAEAGASIFGDATRP
ncbi:MAG: dihydroxy-acid dehydratase, partial [Gammaproteobacteria bacterium]|nr:dihydroxy-acid dehydratase [Gammaproteobacteria bacterium]